MRKHTTSSFQDIVQKSLTQERNIFKSEPEKQLNIKEKDIITVDEYKTTGKKKKRNKFNNKPVWYNGKRYQSTKEAEFARNLDWKLKAGLIRSWFRQVPFELNINGIHITKYYCDFRVINNDETISYYDTKGCTEGTAYELFKIKKTLMMICHNINVIET